MSFSSFCIKEGFPVDILMDGPLIMLRKLHPSNESDCSSCGWNTVLPSLKILYLRKIHVITLTENHEELR